MSEFYTMVTQKGIETLTNCIAKGTVFPAVKMSVGDAGGNYYEPTNTQTKLVNAKYTANLYSKGKKNGFLYFNLQLPPSEGNYTIREVGLLDKDNNLLAIAKYPETYKQKAEAASYKTLLIELQIKLSNESFNTIMINDTGELVTKEEIETELCQKADVDLLNLNASGNNRLAVSRIYDSEVSTDEVGYSKVYNLKHSQFDPSKITIVGTPNITNDGVASNFTNNSCINAATLDLTDAATLKIIAKFKTPLASEKENFSPVWYLQGAGIYLGFWGNNIGIINTFGTQTAGVFPYKENTVFEYTFKFNLSNFTYSCSIKEENATGEIKLGEQDAFNLSTASLLQLGIWGAHPFVGGEIYLRDFAVKVDGKEVYNCLKTGTDTVLINSQSVEIPYCEAITGAKVVDAAYRDRVQDWYEQSGKGNYYTIDEDNENFTLPMGDLYGMLQNVDNSALRKTGNETAEGTKTFEKIIIQDTLNADLTLQSKTYDVFNKSAQQYYGIIDFCDKNEQQVGRVDNWSVIGAEVVSRMRAFNPVSGAGADIYAYALDSGETYATAPTPASWGDNSQKIATTAWVAGRVPQYIGGIELTPNTSTTMTACGWILAVWNNANGTLIINGATVLICNTNVNFYDSNGGLFPVKTGDVVVSTVNGTFFLGAS